MLSRPIAAALIALVLPSCSNFRYVVANYGTVKPVSHAGPEHHVRIFDKPEELRMMVTPSLSESLRDGAMSGLTLGIVDTNESKSEMQRQAQDWLEFNEREQEIYKGKLVLNPQWEFFYRAKSEG